MRSLIPVSIVFGLLLGCGMNTSEETQRVRGKLEFESKATVNGIEVEHAPGTRHYLTGTPASRERAVWTFGPMPASFQSAPRQAVPLAFTFDLLSRPTVENRGADVSIRIVTWRCPQKLPADKDAFAWEWADPKRAKDYEDRAREWLFEADRMRGIRRYRSKDEIFHPKAILSSHLTEPGTPDWDVANRLAQEFGFYEIWSRQVFDGHEETVLVPAGLFQNAASTIGPDGEMLPAPSSERVKVYVKCETKGQLLGVTESELYFDNPK